MKKIKPGDMFICSGGSRTQISLCRKSKCLNIVIKVTKDKFIDEDEILAMPLTRAADGSWCGLRERCPKEHRFSFSTKNVRSYTWLDK